MAEKINNFFAGMLFCAEVINITGKMVRTYVNLKGNMSIDLSLLPAGIYIVRLTQEGRRLSRKIIKT